MRALVRVSFTCSTEELNNDHSIKIFHQKFFFMKCSKVLIVMMASTLTGLVLNAQTGQVWSLRQAVETGIKNSLLVNQRDLQAQREEVNFRLAKGDMLPSLNGNINHSLQIGRNPGADNTYSNNTFTVANWGLNSDVTLFNGLRLWNRLRSSQYAYEAGKLEWQQQKDNLTLDIILAYLQILTNTDQLQLARVQTAQVQEQVNRLEILNNQGAILPSDLTDLKGQLAQNKLNEINTANALEQAKLSLAQLMNIPYDSTLQVERMTVEQFDVNYNSTPDSIYRLASEQLAMVRAAEMRRKSAEKTVAAARGNLIPSIGFGASYGTQFYSNFTDANTNKTIPYYDQLKNNYGFGLGIGVNIPFLNGFFNRNQVRLAKINLKESEIIEQTTQLRLKQSIERDYVNMKTAVNRYQALVEQVAALTESFRAAEARFNAGVGNSVDFLLARNRMDQANINLIVARYDYALRTKILDYYQGRPLF
jgi:outer membrane protein